MRFAGIYFIFFVVPAGEKNIPMVMRALSVAGGMSQFHLLERNS
jgi:hypothetical protein